MNKDSENYSEEETIARREATLKRMLAAPPKHHDDMRLGRARDVGASAAVRKKLGGPNSGEESKC